MKILIIEDEYNLADIIKDRLVKEKYTVNICVDGGEVTLNMKNQQVNGNIVVDYISTLEMNLKNKSIYEGTINTDNTAKSIKLTANSYVTSLEDANESYSNIDFNGYKLYLNGKATN